MVDAQLKRETVLETAATLFESGGYDETSLEDIATAADVPLELLRQDYAGKEQIALELYHMMAESTLSSAGNLSEGNISDRYFSVMEDKLAQLNSHQEAVSALFAIAMRPKSAIKASDISPGLRDPMMAVMQAVIHDADDKPIKDEDDLAYFLYAFHFLVIVFWLYDRTDEKEASHMFTGFLREFVKLVRPMMVMPMVGKAMNRMAKIMMVVFGGARLVDPDTSST